MWGAATSAYQVEGDNIYADWWFWDFWQKTIAPSGKACDHYRLFRQDFDLAKKLKHNAHRFSIEWSRIQPRQESFNQNELQHYRDVVSYLAAIGIEPVATLHHFTNPIWLAKVGGWAHPSCVRHFLTYVEKTVTLLAEKVRFWVTINEPMVHVYFSYIAGRWPPQSRSLVKAKIAMDSMARAHIKAYRLIHDIYRKKNLPPPKVGIAHNTVAFVPCKQDFRDRYIAGLRDFWFNYRFLDVLYKRKALDYIGINYYTRHLIDTDRWSLNEVMNNACKKGHDTLPKNVMGWEIYPQGLYDILVGMKKYGLPVFILENGICARDDNQRWEYIRAHLLSVHRAIKDQVPVIGYLYWSLLDNFEWDSGFVPRFGLCEVDFKTMERTPRPSAEKFGRVCVTGRLEE